MSAITVKLEWYKDSVGYELKNYGKYGTKISRKGGPLVPTSRCAMTEPLRRSRM